MSASASNGSSESAGVGNAGFTASGGKSGGGPFLSSIRGPEGCNTNMPKRYKKKTAFRLMVLMKNAGKTK